MEKRRNCSTIFYYLLLDSHVKAVTRFLLRDKRLFEISEVEITRIDCSGILQNKPTKIKCPDETVRTCKVRASNMLKTYSHLTEITLFFL